jgi:uncharacterized PurR-regulated membrane protein YhhQ (DUF165 family)
MKKLTNWVKQQSTEYGVLLRSIPAHIVTLFTVSVIFMNVFASVSLVNLPWLAVDGGIILAWLPFLTMDMICKRFGARAANKITIFGIVINLCCVGLFNIVNLIIKSTPDWNGWLDGENGVFATLAGNWKTLVSSMAAMLLSALVNNFVNTKIKRKDNFTFKNFALASYVSTFIGQFVDNMTFGLFAHQVFNIWGSPLSIVQITMMSLTGAMVELLCEVVFSPVGFKICKKWTKDNVGSEYLTLVNA